MTPVASNPTIRVNDIEIHATDSREQYREKLARVILDSMIQFVGLLDANGTVLEINKVALRNAGVTLAEVEGKPFWTTFWWQVSEEVNHALRQSIARAARGEIVHWDTTINRHNGRTGTMVIDASLCPVSDEKGNVVFIVAEGRDISEKKACELEIMRKNIELQDLHKRISELGEIGTEAPDNGGALETKDKKRISIETTNQDRELRLRKLGELFEQTPSFMVVLRGPTHIFEFANNAFYKLTGERDLIGRSAVDAFPEIKGQGFFELLDQVLATGEPFQGTGLPVSLQREPGLPLEQRYVDFVFQPLIEDNVKSGVFVEGHDVTDQKHAEETLRTADRRKDEFLATLAHELRNPLAPIRHAAMISQSGNPTAAELKRSHEVIVRQVEHMGRLLDDLLDVSRITSLKVELRKEVLPLNDSVIAAVETSRPLIEARGHQLTIAVPPTVSYIDADPVRFDQIISNLLTNAAKYTDRGGRIAVQVKLVKGFAVITIRDNGIGMSPEQLPRLFQMFSQATTAIERSEGGLGIGLALVHGLVLLHGGLIEGRSAGIGRGSEFIVTLPLAPAPEPKAPPADETPKRQTQVSKRVLVVDDHQDNADLFSILIKRAGHEVRTAYSGKEALSLAAEFKPNFVLLDIGMPHMNGFEVARQIRDSDWGKKAVLVAITGWGQDEDKRRAIAAGFNHHVTKPFDPNVLKRLLAKDVETDS